jgi:hypothetical protein
MKKILCCLSAILPAIIAGCIDRYILGIDMQQFFSAGQQISHVVTWLSAGLMMNKLMD